MCLNGKHAHVKACDQGEAGKNASGDKEYVVKASVDGVAALLCLVVSLLGAERKFNEGVVVLRFCARPNASEPDAL